MREDTPTVYLLAGPPGPGKIAYIRALEERGVHRLQAESELSDETAATLVEHLESGRDVLLDYAKADQPERDRIQCLAHTAAAESLTINFSIDHDRARRIDGGSGRTPFCCVGGARSAVAHRDRNFAE